MIDSEKNNYTCVNCHATLPDHHDNGEITCSSCGKTYPVINSIPVFIGNQEYYFADNFYTYCNLIAAHENHITQITENFKFQKDRLNVAENLKEAIRDNLNLVRPIPELLRSYVSPYQLVNLRASHQGNLNKYLKDLNYLRRDWCWLPEGEEQLKAVETSISSILENHNADKNSLLVLGAGLGRIAWGLSPHFQKVYATDKSFSMSYFYHKLLSEDIVFYETNSQNIRNNTSTTRVLKASVHEPGNSNENAKKKDFSKIEYFVSDVTQLPLEDNSISCSLSVYFTDVLALKLYMHELRRVIKKDGLFIHFGPLGYPFEDESAMLSQEDIKSEFMKNGFTPIVDKTINTSHTSSALSMTENLMHNWLFVAVKTEDAPNDIAKNISLNTVFNFKDEVYYETKGSLSNIGESVDYFNLISGTGKVYEGAETMLDILREVDGVKSIAQIFEALSQQYELDNDVLDSVFEELKKLYLDNILGIAKL